MPWQTDPQFAIGPDTDGPALQVELNSTVLGLASVIGATSTILSNIIGSGGYNLLSLAVKSAQAGSLSIQPYLDALGTVSQGSPVTAALAAGAVSIINTGLAQIGAPYAAFTVSVSNTSAGGSSALQTCIGLLQGGAVGAAALAASGAAISSANPLPTGRILAPVKLDSTTGVSGWSSLADLSASPGGYLEVQNRGTATMVVQIGGATGGDTTGAVETISVLGTYLTPGLNTQAKFFVSSGASGAAIPYGGWKA